MTVPTATIAEPGDAEPGMAFDTLIFQAFMRREAVFVKGFGGEAAEVGMEAPGFGEKEPGMGGNGVGTMKKMLKRGDFSTIGMAAFERLVELLGVAQQDETLGGRGDGERVGERHLAGPSVPT